MIDIMLNAVSRRNRFHIIKTLLKDINQQIVLNDCMAIDQNEALLKQAEYIIRESRALLQISTVRNYLRENNLIQECSNLYHINLWKDLKNIEEINNLILHQAEMIGKEIRKLEREKSTNFLSVLNYAKEARVIIKIASEEKQVSEQSELLKKIFVNQAVKEITDAIFKVPEGCDSFSEVANSKKISCLINLIEPLVQEIYPQKNLLTLDAGENIYFSSPWLKTIMGFNKLCQEGDSDDAFQKFAMEWLQGIEPKQLFRQDKKDNVIREGKLFQVLEYIQQRLQKIPCEKRSVELTELLSLTEKYRTNTLPINDSSRELVLVQDCIRYVRSVNITYCNQGRPLEPLESKEILSNLGVFIFNKFKYLYCQVYEIPHEEIYSKIEKELNDWQSRLLSGVALVDDDPYNVIIDILMNFFFDIFQLSSSHQWLLAFKSEQQNLLKYDSGFYQGLVNLAFSSIGAIRTQINLNMHQEFSEDFNSKIAYHLRLCQGLSFILITHLQKMTQALRLHPSVYIKVIKLIEDILHHTKVNGNMYPKTLAEYAEDFKDYKADKVYFLGEETIRDQYKNYCKIYHEYEKNVEEYLHRNRLPINFQDENKKILNQAPPLGKLLSGMYIEEYVSGGNSSLDLKEIVEPKNVLIKPISKMEVQLPALPRDRFKLLIPLSQCPNPLRSSRFLPVDNYAFFVSKRHEVIDVKENAIILTEIREKKSACKRAYFKIITNGKKTKTSLILSHEEDKLIGTLDIKRMDVNYKAIDNLRRKILIKVNIPDSIGRFQKQLSLWIESLSIEDFDKLINYSLWQGKENGLIIAFKVLFSNFIDGEYLQIQDYLTKNLNGEENFQFILSLLFSAFQSNFFLLNHFANNLLKHLDEEISGYLLVPGRISQVQRLKQDTLNIYREWKGKEEREEKKQTIIEYTKNASLPILYWLFREARSENLSVLAKNLCSSILHLIKALENASSIDQERQFQQACTSFKSLGLVEEKEIKQLLQFVFTKSSFSPLSFFLLLFQQGCTDEWLLLHVQQILVNYAEWMQVKLIKYLLDKLTPPSSVYRLKIAKCLLKLQLEKFNEVRNYSPILANLLQIAPWYKVFIAIIELMTSQPYSGISNFIKNNPREIVPKNYEFSATLIDYIKTIETLLPELQGVFLQNLDKNFDMLLIQAMFAKGVLTADCRQQRYYLGFNFLASEIFSEEAHTLFTYSSLPPSLSKEALQIFPLFGQMNLCAIKNSDLGFNIEKFILSKAVSAHCLAPFFALLKNDQLYAFVENKDFKSPQEIINEICSLFPSFNHRLEQHINFLRREAKEEKGIEKLVKHIFDIVPSGPIAELLLGKMLNYYVNFWLEGKARSEQIHKIATILTMGPLEKSLLASPTGIRSVFGRYLHIEKFTLVKLVELQNALLHRGCNQSTSQNFYLIKDEKDFFEFKKYVVTELNKELVNADLNFIPLIEYMATVKHCAVGKWLKQIAKNACDDLTFIGSLMDELELRGEIRIIPRELYSHLITYVTNLLQNEVIDKKIAEKIIFWLSNPSDLSQISLQRPIQQEDIVTPKNLMSAFKMLPKFSGLIEEKKEEKYDRSKIEVCSYLFNKVFLFAFKANLFFSNEFTEIINNIDDEKWSTAMAKVDIVNNLENFFHDVLSKSADPLQVIESVFEKLALVSGITIFPQDCQTPQEKIAFLRGDNNQGLTLSELKQYKKARSESYGKFVNVLIEEILTKSINLKFPESLPPISEKNFALVERMIGDVLNADEPLRVENLFAYLQRWFQDQICILHRSLRQLSLIMNNIEMLSQEEVSRIDTHLLNENIYYVVPVILDGSSTADIYKTIEEQKENALSGRYFLYVFGKSSRPKVCIWHTKMEPKKIKIYQVADLFLDYKDLMERYDRVKFQYAKFKSRRHNEFKSGNSKEHKHDEDKVFNSILIADEKEINILSGIIQEVKGVFHSVNSLRVISENRLGLSIYQFEQIAVVLRFYSNENGMKYRVMPEESTMRQLPMLESRMQIFRSERREEKIN